MPYYRNKTSHHWPITLSGKRFVIKPNQEFSNETEINTTIYEFLEKIDTPTNITDLHDRTKKPPIKTVSPETIKDLSNRVITEINDIKTIIKTTDDIKTIIHDVLKETPQVEVSEVKELHEKLKNLESIWDSLSKDSAIDDIKTEVVRIRETQTTILKRLEIMKNAVETINQALYTVESELYYGDNEPVVILDEDSEDDSE